MVEQRRMNCGDQLNVKNINDFSSRKTFGSSDKAPVTGRKKSVVSKSKNSSIQSRQVKVDIVYSIQKNGTKYGCKISSPLFE